MYEVKHEEHLIYLNTMEEVIQSITDIHNDCKQYQLQIVAIKLNDTKIEIGVGDKQDRTVLLFYAKSSQEDSYLSFNQGSLEASITFYRKNSIPFECREYNLIPIDIALTELSCMLSNSCLSKAIRWVSL